MNAQRWWLLGVVITAVVVILLGRWLWNGADAEVAASPEQGEGLRPLGSVQAPVLPPSGEVALSPLPSEDVPLVPVPETSVDAAESMARALEHGDPQAPKVVRDAPREMPTEAELADPAAYQRYEARQNQRLYGQFVKAADDEIPRLQADIARAKAAGLPPEQIAEGEEKLRRIQAMRDQLKADNPGLQ